jgi:hypothetical protein
LDRFYFDVSYQSFKEPVPLKRTYTSELNGRKKYKTVCESTLNECTIYGWKKVDESATVKSLYIEDFRKALHLKCIEENKDKKVK